MCVHFIHDIVLHSLICRRVLTGSIHRHARPALSTLILVGLLRSSAFAGATLPANGRGWDYWQDHSVICAIVEDIQPAPKADDPRNLIVMRPVGTLTGPFDSGDRAIVRIAVDIARFIHPGRTIADFDGIADRMDLPPDPTAKKGSLVLAALYHDPFRGSVVYRFEAWCTYMPGKGSPFFALDSLSDEEFQKTLATLQKKRKDEKRPPNLDKNQHADIPWTRPGSPAKYWLTRSLIYSEVRSVVETTSRKERTLVVRPKLTLSGEFDCGRHPELSLRADKTSFDPKNQAPSAGSKVLIVVTEHDGAYNVASDGNDLMPRPGTPICTVKDFSDPKVTDTLRKIQDARSK